MLVMSLPFKLLVIYAYAISLYIGAAVHHVAAVEASKVTIVYITALHHVLTKQLSNFFAGCIPLALKHRVLYPMLYSSATRHMDT